MLSASIMHCMTAVQVSCCCKSLYDCCEAHLHCAGLHGIAVLDGSVDILSEHTALQTDALLIR